MGAKYSTLTIGAQPAWNILLAARYAGETDRPLNIAITVNFAALGIEDERADLVFQDLRGRVVRWWRDQRTRKGKDIGPWVDVHCRANPAGSSHVHWVAHIPPQIRAEFEAVLAKRLAKLVEGRDLGSSLDVREIYNLGGYLKYILRGIHPGAAPRYFIRPANEGQVHGRRTGTSRAIGRATRNAVGWKRRGGRRPTGQSR